MDSEKSTVLTEIEQMVIESRENPKLDKLEKALIEDFADRVSNVLADFESFEKEGESIPNPDSPNADFRKKFTKLFSSFLNIPSGFGIRLRLGYALVQTLQGIWTTALHKIEEIIEREQHKIGIESWGLSLGVSFPMGVSGTISVTFKNTS